MTWPAQMDINEYFMNIIEKNYLIINKVYELKNLWKLSEEKKYVI